MTDAICSVDGCLAHVHAKGWCKYHYTQAHRNNGDPLARQRVRNGVPRAYFDAHLMTVTSQCKIWPFMLDDGYGMLKVGRRNIGVHVLACEAWHGPRPPGMEAAHGPCHMRACFNGAHLSWETRSEQMLDMKRDSTDPVGSRNPFSRLTEQGVRVIRVLHASGMRRALIAEEFNVHHNTIDLIVRRVSWRHVE